MDTVKEKLLFDAMYARGEMPWAVWQNKSNVSTTTKIPNIDNLSKEEVLLGKS
jgi:hypothetical protein